MTARSWRRAFIRRRWRVDVRQSRASTATEGQAVDVAESI